MIRLLLCLPFLACEETETTEEVETSVEEVPHTPIDLSDPEQNLEAFVKMRGSLDPEEETVFYWTGAIYKYNDADPVASPLTSYHSEPILYFEGFNIGRFEKISDQEYQFLSREISVYKNRAGKIIDCWSNRPLGGSENVRVVHVQNDPVNFVIGGANYREMDDMVIWNMEIFLSYPSALNIDDYPNVSAGNTYQSIELFNFYSQREDLEDPTLDSVPVHLSWTRFGQHLPWMRMGMEEGKLVYHTTGYKVLGGFDDLPQDLQEWTLQNAPEYQHAPERYVYPNVTSWKYMKQIMDSGEYDPECP